MSPPAEVLQNALTSRGRDRRSRASVYLNRRGRHGVRAGAWLSEVGFYSQFPFAYSAADESNLLPREDDPIAVDRVELHLYGAARDYLRLGSQSAEDRVVRTSRRTGQTGVAPYPDLPGYVGAADLQDDTSLPEKTSQLLGLQRTGGSGTAYHVVVTRAGAVYVTAPFDQPSALAQAPQTSLVVALEGACYRPAEGGDILDAPLTEPQLASLSVLVAKIKAAHPALALTWGEGLRYLAGPQGAASSRDLWLVRSTEAQVGFLERVSREGVYDVSREVYLRNPPPTSRRAEAQVAMGQTSTAGESSLLLGSYADIAAEDRSNSMQEPVRTRYFVARARAAHTEADSAGEAAAHVAGAPALTAPPAPATNSSPFVYNYITGRWGNE